MSNRKIDLDPRLSHRVVQYGGYWGKGADLSEAKKAYRSVAGRRAPREVIVWAVTPETTIDERGCFHAPMDKRVQPVCLIGAPEVGLKEVNDGLV